MIIGVGTDLVDVTRIASSLDRFGERFAKKILTEDELVGFRSSARPDAYVAKRFSAKEAVSKALGTGMRQGVSFTSIAIAHTTAGQPLVNLNGAAQQLAKDKGIERWHLSISDEKQYAVAFVVAES